MVVDAGVNVTEVPLKAPGFQVYVSAPVPVILVEVPAQTDDKVTVAPTVGAGFTTTVTDCVLLQPFDVIVKLYTTLTGLAVVLTNSSFGLVL